MPDLIDQLRGVLANRPLPRWGRMGPELGYGRHRGPARTESRRAAVLIALFERDGWWRLPLTMRHAGMSRHQGQISLPGGLIEPGETGEAAAVREFGEELGPTSIEILGALDDCYVYVSDTVATPWVGVIERLDVWQPNPREVERVIEVPVDSLNAPEVRNAITIQRGPLRFDAPSFAIGEDRVWGATAVMLDQLAKLISLGKQA